MSCSVQRETPVLSPLSKSARQLRPEWCCIRTHPKHEHIAGAQLSHIPELEVFNPQLNLERRTRRGRMRITESLFKGYLFARFVTQTKLERVRYTPSVKAVLQFGNRVATIPDNVIEELQRTMADYEDEVFTEAPLEGDEAEISSGPFQGEKGVITRVMPARRRVEILLEVMGRPLPAEFSLSSIIFKPGLGAPRAMGLLQKAEGVTASPAPHD
jgi:transcriptional antiterminator RfaH